MVTFLLIAAVTILVFLCFIGPDGPIRTNRPHLNRLSMAARSLKSVQPSERDSFCGGRELRSASSMTELSLESNSVPARQRAQLSPPPASSFDSKRSHRPVVTGPDSAQGDL
jgi:hypothetical protein